MSFKDFLANSVEGLSEAGRFQHSQRIFQRFDTPTPEQAADSAALLMDIQNEIVAKFESEYNPCIERMNALMAEVKGYRSAGAIQPLSVFQAQCYLMGHMVTLCQSYQTDADVLAKLGTPGFQAYLKKLLDDAIPALAELKKTPVAGMLGPSLSADAFLAELRRMPVEESADFDPTRGPMWGYAGPLPGATSPIPAINPTWPFLPSPPHL